MANGNFVFDGLDDLERLDLIEELMEKIEVSNGMDEDDLDLLDITDRIMEIVELLTNDDVERPDIQPEGATPEGDEEWERDLNVLNLVINKKHDMMADPTLKYVLLPIYERAKGDQDRLGVVTRAVDAWAEFVIELTKNL